MNRLNIFRRGGGEGGGGGNAEMGMGGMQTRLPPPTGAPPSYARAIKKVYPYSLRPIMITISIVGLVWAVILGVDNIQDVGDEGSTTKMNASSIALAIIYFVIAGIELFSTGVAIMNKLQFAKLFVIIAPLGAVLAVAAQAMDLALHFTLKNDLIAQCVTIVEGSSVSDRYGTVSQMTEEQSQDYCKSSWNRGTWRDVVWLIAVLCLSFLWFSIMLSYYRQLLDPSSIRQRGTNPLERTAHPLQPYPGYQQGPYNAGPYNSGGDYPTFTGDHRQDYVPPYPGPPPANSPYAPKTNATGESDAKELDHREMSYEAQEAAWEEAQRRGPTANIGATAAGSGAGAGGYAPPTGPPPGRQMEGNYDEEEDAWRAAQRDGPTAHLTGGDGGRMGGARI